MNNSNELTLDDNELELLHDEDDTDSNDEEIDEPDEDAITTSDDRTFYQYGKRVLAIGEDDDRDQELVRFMNRSQFWPDCWSISDHGNAHRIDLQAAYDTVGPDFHARCTRCNFESDRLIDGLCPGCTDKAEENEEN